VTPAQESLLRYAAQLDNDDLDGATIPELAAMLASPGDMSERRRVAIVYRLDLLRSHIVDIPRHRQPPRWEPCQPGE